MDSWVGNYSSMCGSVCCGRMRLLHFLFYCVEPPVGVNVSVGLGELLLGVSPTLEVAPLLVVAPLEVAPPLEMTPLTRSRELPVVHMWARLVMGCKRGGFGGGGEGGLEDILGGLG